MQNQAARACGPGGGARAGGREGETGGGEEGGSRESKVRSKERKAKGGRFVGSVLGSCNDASCIRARVIHYQGKAGGRQRNKGEVTAPARGEEGLRAHLQDTPSRLLINLSKTNQRNRCFASCMERKPRRGGSQRCFVSRRQGQEGHTKRS